MTLEEVSFTAGLHGTRFLRAILRNFSVWKEVDLTMFHSFVQLAKLEPVAELVEFEPRYDPEKGSLKFQFRTDRSTKNEPANIVEIEVADNGAVDEYKQYLLKSVQAIVSKKQHFSTLEEELKVNYPIVWSQVLERGFMTETPSAVAYAAV